MVAFLKKFFKIQSIKDVWQIFIILVLCFLNLIIIRSFLQGFFPNIFPKKPCSGCGFAECRTGYKKSLSYLNQAVELNYHLDNNVPLDNANDFALMLSKRLMIIDTRNIKGNEKYPEKDLTKQEIKKYNIAQYQGKPIIKTADAMNFVITKFKQGCKNIDETNIENCDCVIDVDISGFEINKNELTKDCKKPRDIIRYYIDGNKNKILVPDIYKPCVFDPYNYKKTE